ncbi:MAG: type 4a pilus biogenesis protein PilO [Candidatus Omnitrophota bacterium]
MTKIKIDSTERNLIITIIAMLVASFLFWMFVYAPKKKEMLSIDRKIKEFGVDIEKAKTELEKTEDYNAKIQQMQSEIVELETKFPKDTQLSTILKYIFEESKRNFLEIETITPGELKAYIPRNPSLDIAELNCQQKLFELKVKCRYRDLADFLKTLKNNPRYIFSIEQLEIAKEKEILPQLRVKLVIGVYVLSSRPKVESLQ